MEHEYFMPLITIAITWSSSRTLPGDGNILSIEGSDDLSTMICNPDGSTPRVSYSNNFGVSWNSCTFSADPGNYANLSISADGTHSIAISNSGTITIYLSTNNCVNYTAISGPSGKTLNNGGCITKTGNIIIVQCTDYTMYKSTDFGVTWTQIFVGLSGQSKLLAVSRDGSIILLAYPYISSNYAGIVQSSDSGTTYSQVYISAFPTSGTINFYNPFTMISTDKTKAIVPYTTNGYGIGLGVLTGAVIGSTWGFGGFVG